MKSPKDRKPEPDIPPFTNGDTVRRRFDSEKAGMIVGTLYWVGGTIQYLVSWADETEPHSHFAEELKLDEDFIEKAN